MPNEDVNEYIIRGINGPKEIKHEETTRYLGVFRERVVIALTQKQVRTKSVYPEIQQLMMKYPAATMLLNGEMEYEALSKYIKLADQLKKPYRKFSDHNSDTELGLVLACPEAVDVENIYVADEIPEKSKFESEEEAEQSGFSSFFRKLFR